MFRILIVDDETLQRDGIAEMLRLRNPDDLITEARDGLEALSIIRAIKPGIVLTDIRMPNLSGLDLLKNIKQEAPETQVIVISGYNEFEYAKKALQHNASDYLLKPIDEKELAEVIKNARIARLKVSKPCNLC
ncbi:MAG: response regulator [Aliarcobacter sp.]